MLRERDPHSQGFVRSLGKGEHMGIEAQGCQVSEVFELHLLSFVVSPETGLNFF